MPEDDGTRSGGAARVQGVSHRYGHTTALSAVDLKLRWGSIAALVGPNGSGKTTLLRILAGILEPGAGEVEVLGIPHPARCGRGTRLELRRQTGYVSQDPALDPEMTGGEILNLAATLYGVPRRQRRGRVADLATAFAIDSHLGRRVSTWSGGLRRRLHLAAGMIHDPRLLLLDEPTAGLDPEGRRLLWEGLARRAERGRSAAIVTHDLAAAQRYAGTVVVLDQGVLVAAGSPAQLLGSGEAKGTDLTEAYRRLTGRDAVELLPRKHRRPGGMP